MSEIVSSLEMAKTLMGHLPSQIGAIAVGETATLYQALAPLAHNELPPQISLVNTNTVTNGYGFGSALISA